ncbi:hypothetical protein DFJ63DRAFT_336569 [Scheffersomyces coipomensis]|uniref:uncharacterized protein n=1 Tax=Scheffersomyces coipomensis TaxID=1788519 RepID=UPI00315DD051
MINDIKTSTYLKSASSTPFSNSSNSSFPSSTTSNNNNNNINNSNTTILKKKSLRSLKSSSPLNPSSHTTPGPTSSSNNNSSGSKVSFFKKISSEWNFLLLRLRSISEEVFTSDELIDDLFTEVDEEDHFDRLMRSSKGYTSMEETFLQEFKKFKSLDKMVEYHQQQQQGQNQSSPSNDVKSSTTLISDSQTKLNYTLQDFIRQSFTPDQEEADQDLSDNDEDILDDMDYNDITYQDLDLYKLKQELEIQKKSLINNNPSVNIGVTLWEFRRSKWLHNANTPAIQEKLKSRLTQTSISNIPRDSYVKIYNYLIDKNRVLKNNKRINLSDLIKIINIGWIAEEKWERAAKGLP